MLFYIFLSILPREDFPPFFVNLPFDVLNARSFNYEESTADHPKLKLKQSKVSTTHSIIEGTKRVFTKFIRNAETYTELVRYGVF